MKNENISINFKWFFELYAKIYGNLQSKQQCDGSGNCHSQHQADQGLTIPSYFQLSLIKMKTGHRSTKSVKQAPLESRQPQI